MPPVVVQNHHYAHFAEATLANWLLLMSWQTPVRMMSSALQSQGDHQEGLSIVKAAAVALRVCQH